MEGFLLCLKQRKLVQWVLAYVAAHEFPPIEVLQDCALPEPA